MIRVRVRVRVRVKIAVRTRVRIRIRVKAKVTAGGGGCNLIWPVWFCLVWNDDVCIRRAHSAHQLDSDILVSAKLQLYLHTNY